MNGMERTSRTERRRATGARRIGAVITCAVAVAAAPAASWADDAAMAKDAGVGLGSAIASLLYAPVKTAYALGGVVVGGLAWAFSGGDAEVARVVEHLPGELQRQGRCGHALDRGEPAPAPRIAVHLLGERVGLAG